MSKIKTAIITGVTGQDGSYLSELLLLKGYNVIGLKRRTSTNTDERLSSALNHPNFSVLEADLIDPSSINHVISDNKPDEFYNLAAQSHVATSFTQPVYTFQANAVGVLYCLEAIRKYSPNTRFYQASSSEMFGSNFSSNRSYTYHGYNLLPESEKYQDESTVLSPNSPYAVSKVAAHQLVQQYRRSYDIFACAGVLFNHESERRGETFVTRKITKYVADLNHYRGSLRALQQESKENFPQLRLGNLDAQRDWGYAPDYVQAMYLMMQQDSPDDYVIATEKAHSIKDFLTEAFNHIGIKNWEPYVVIDPEFFRPCDVEFLCGRTKKARDVLGWTPETDFKTLVGKMVDYDILKRKNKI